MYKVCVLNAEENQTQAISNENDWERCFPKHTYSLSVQYPVPTRIIHENMYAANTIDPNTSRRTEFAHQKWCAVVCSAVGSSHLESKC